MLELLKTAKINLFKRFQKYGNFGNDLKFLGKEKCITLRRPVILWWNQSIPFFNLFNFCTQPFDPRGPMLEMCQVWCYITFLAITFATLFQSQEVDFYEVTETSSLSMETVSKCIKNEDLLTLQNLFKLHLK